MSSQLASKLSLLRLQGTQLLNSIHSLNQSAYPPAQIPQLSLMKDVSSSLAKSASSSNTTSTGIPTPDGTFNGASVSGSSSAYNSTTSSNAASILSSLSKRKISKKDQKVLDLYSKRIMHQYEELWLWIEKLMNFVDFACLEIVDCLWVVGFKDVKSVRDLTGAPLTSATDSAADESQQSDADMPQSSGGDEHDQDRSQSSASISQRGVMPPKQRRLLHIRNKSEVLSVDMNFVKEIMNVLTILCKILLGLEGGAVSNYIEKVALYNLAYKSLQSNGKNHKTYILLQNLLQKFSPNPMAHLQQIFSPTVNDVMCPLLNQLIDTYDRTDFRRLKTELAMELLSNPQQISMPSINQIHFELTHTSTIDEWLLFGLLVFPEALFWGEKSKQAQEYNEMVRHSIQLESSDRKKAKKSKTIKEKKIKLKELTPQLQFLQDRLLATSYVLSVGSNKVVYLHDLYEQLILNNKVLRKLKKKWVKQTEAVAAKRSHTIHAEYRAYCRKYLHEVLSLLEENPGIIGVKFQLILSVFSLAQKELLWYFHHSLQSKAALSVTVKDEYVHEIIYLVERITKLCLTNRSIIQTYNLKLMRLPFKSELIRSVDSIRPLLDDHIMNCINSILKDIEECEENFDVVRLNWKHLLVYLCKSPAIVQHMSNAAVKHFLSLMDHISFISSHVDHVSDQLLQHGGLAQLYFFSEHISHIFEESLVGRDTQPLYTMSLIRVLAFFPENAHRTFNTQLRQTLGVRAINDAQIMLQKLAKFIGSDLLEEYVLLFEKVTSPVPSTSIHNVISVRTSSRLPKVSSREENEAKLAQLKMNLSRLIIGVAESGSLDIHDATFFPSEFIKDEMELFVEHFIAHHITKTGSSSTRSASSSKSSKRNSVGDALQEVPLLPSVMLQRFSSLIQALNIVNESLHLNVHETVCKCMLEHFYMDTEMVTSGKENVVTRYAHHVCRLIASPPDDKIVFDCGRYLPCTSLVSPKELEALMEMGGPYAVRVIDTIVCQHISKYVRRLRKSLSSIAEDLDSVLPRFFSEQLKEHELRALPNAQDATNLLISIGALVEFRKAIHDALQKMMRRKVPVLYNVVSMCGIHLDDTTFLQHVGVKIDSQLKEMLRDYLQDSCWKRLHLIFVLGSLMTHVWNPKGTMSEAWTTNRLLAIRGFVDLLALLHSKKEQHIILQETSRFMIAALHQLRTVQQSKHAAQSMIFVDKFLGMIPQVIPQDELEQTLPVYLIRDAYLRSKEEQ